MRMDANMLFFMICTAIIFIIWVAGKVLCDYECGEWFNIQYTTCVKGVAILTVVWAHIGKAYQVPFIQFIAGIGVALFLICSGYGVETSFQKKGLEKYWIKKIQNVYMPYLLVLCIYNVIKMIFEQNINIVNFIKSIFLIKANWFLRFIFLYYILFFIIKILITKVEKLRNRELFIWGVAVTILFIYYSVNIYADDAPFLQARQIFSFPLGMLIAQNKEVIKNKMTVKKGIWLASLCIVMGVLFMGITQLNIVKQLPYIVSNMMSLFTCLSFAIAFLFIVARYKFIVENKFIYIIGLYSYELFLIQQKTIPILDDTVLSKIIFTVVTIGGTILVYWCCALLFKGKNKKHNMENRV